MGRTIAIGDIHGCSKALESLLRRIAPAADDLIITMGDYIDRGPDSRGVIDQLLRLPEMCRHIALMGNHEIMLLAVLQDSTHSPFWMQCGGRETIESYGGDIENVPEDHLHFVRGCLPHYETESHLFVHANYNAGAPLEEQEDELLYWRHLSQGLPGPHESGKIAVVGHTPQPGGRVLDLDHVVCVDTFCFGDGCLTALDVDSRETWQSNKQGQSWVLDS
ncbi:MAG: metallophosphoesterase family protein [Pirellulaceae bacterium]|jgi:serine/threonine protein phosphatase 1|nr:metallophosphoesterase family protein [Pirellulaceae bacterium]